MVLLMRKSVPPKAGDIIMDYRNIKFMITDISENPQSKDIVTLVELHSGKTVNHLSWKDVGYFLAIEDGDNDPHAAVEALTKYTPTRDGAVEVQEGASHQLINIINYDTLPKEVQDKRLLKNKKEVQETFVYVTNYNSINQMLTNIMGPAPVGGAAAGGGGNISTNPTIAKAVGGPVPICVVENDREGQEVHTDLIQSDDGQIYVCKTVTRTQKIDPLGKMREHWEDRETLLKTTIGQAVKLSNHYLDNGSQVVNVSLTIPSSIPHIEVDIAIDSNSTSSNQIRI